MAIAYVQSNSSNPGGVSTGALAYASPNGAGNLLVAAVRYAPAAQTMSLTDTQGNNWLPVNDLQGSNNGVFLFYAPNCAGGANTVTFHGGGTGTAMRVAIAEYSGADPVAPLDVSTDATAVGTAVSVPLTTTGPAELLVLANGVSAASTATAGSAQYNVEEQVSNFFSFTDGLGVTAATETGVLNLSASVTWIAVMAAFIPFVDATSPTLVPGSTYRITEFTYLC